MKSSRVALTRLVIVALGIFGAVQTAYASGVGCDRWEYAKLKDSTKKELITEYCRTDFLADTNKEISAMNGKFRDTYLKYKDFVQADEYSKKVDSADNARFSCMKAAQDAADMLMKKFKSPPPKTCEKEFPKP